MHINILIKKKQQFRATLSFFSLFVLISFTLHSAKPVYDKAWNKVNTGELDSAIFYFEQAAEDQTYKEKALLCLTMLHTQERQVEKAAEYFHKYMDVAENPYPALFALWFNDAVVGSNVKKNDQQYQLLQLLEKKKDNPLSRAVLYRLYLHKVFSNELKQSEIYAEQLRTLKNWSVVGPFGNIVNSGFNKNFGVLANPKPEAGFSSKFGAKVKWLENPTELKDGYYFKGTNFLSENSIVYAQTFIESETEQTVIVSFGYSGSLKLWVNDHLIYSESNRRRTELDFYQIKLKLNQGYNRFLVQLGDYNEPSASFSIRLMDTTGKELNTVHTAKYQDYQKKLDFKQSVPHFAIEHFQQKISENENDLLARILLASTYMRGLEVDKAEKIYKNILQEHPHNFFALKNLVILYSETGNTTSQSKYYGILEETNPHLYDFLSNELEEAYQNEDESKFNHFSDLLLSKYPSKYDEKLIEMKKALLSENYPALIEAAKTLYEDFPDKYDPMASYYKIQKDYFKDFYTAKTILEKYLKHNYNYSVTEELANLYIANGNHNKALKLFQELHKYFPYQKDILKKQVYVLFQDKKFQEAEKICHDILRQAPLDYGTSSDISNLAIFMHDQEKALEYLQKTNEYFPFSFETNETIRELKGKKKMIEIIGEVRPKQIIQEFEAIDDPQWKKSSYDIIHEKKAVVVYASSARAQNHNYILRLNDDDALEYWQNLGFETSSDYSLQINDAYTIKKTGEIIQAEKHNGNEVVFLNLEVGDYIFVNYTESQIDGGYASRYISDKYSFSSQNPIYKLEYNLYFEDGLNMRDTLSRGIIKPVVEKLDGFTHYRWSSMFPQSIENENYVPSSEEIIETLEYTFVPSWDEIVRWYSDLVSHQAEADYTIEKISTELFDGKNYTDEEKFKKIYEFIGKNIQYSSIDFRQSNFIPQKASQTYHSRLGDCKDMATLFVSLARHAGLRANLVLILTNSSKSSMLLPSLNFNHCIVKIYLDSTEKYLELTSAYLPFGYLQYYHENAPILEIPFESGTEGSNAKLEYLSYNNGYTNLVQRENLVTIRTDGKVQIDRRTMNTGVAANYICDTYYNLGKSSRIQNLKEAIGNKFISNISIDSIGFTNLEPRKDSILYSYSFEVENDLLKIGELKTLKIPFSDLIIGMNIFEDDKRLYDFDYKEYEIMDLYNESFLFQLEGKQKFTKIPTDVHLNYNGNQYSLTFEKLDDKKLKVSRRYTANREKIKAKDFPEFKRFMTKVNEAENTHILFQ